MFPQEVGEVVFYVLHTPESVPLFALLAPQRHLYENRPPAGIGADAKATRDTLLKGIVYGLSVIRSA